MSYVKRIAILARDTSKSDDLLVKYKPQYEQVTKIVELVKALPIGDLQWMHKRQYEEAVQAIDDHYKEVFLADRPLQKKFREVIDFLQYIYED